MPPDRQVTRADQGHILTNANVWSPDGQWIVYDVRSDADGSVFDGGRIERVHVATGAVEVLYAADRDAHVGVATCHPVDGRVVFIHGPADPTPDWSYGPSHRQGAIVDPARPGVAVRLDARDLMPPFTPGALRGGSHVHLFSPDGTRVSFTYDDAVVPADAASRNVGVSVLAAGPVHVPTGHRRNHDGSAFSVLVSRTTQSPEPGSDQIARAYEDGWVGNRAIAFLGDTRGPDGRTVTEVFIVDLPDDLTRPGDGPLAGTPAALPAPPAGVSQRRLTYTAHRRHPGVQGVRHWLRASPDGSRIAFLMRDDLGQSQLWTVPPAGGPPTQVSRDPWPVGSAFTWSPAGDAIAYVADGSVMSLDPTTGTTRRLTPPAAHAPLPLACVFSPDGRHVAYLHRVDTNGHPQNQVFVVGPIG